MVRGYLSASCLFDTNTGEEACHNNNTSRDRRSHFATTQSSHQLLYRDDDKSNKETMRHGRRAMIALMLMALSSVAISQHVDQDGKSNVSTAAVATSPRNTVTPSSLVPVIHQQDTNRTLRVTRGEWLQMGQDLFGYGEGANFGRAVTMSRNGNRLAIGGWRRVTRRHFVRVYEWNNNSWTQMGSDIFDFVNRDWIGGSLSLSGNGMRLVTGADYYNNRSPGRARVYQWDGSDWTQLGPTLQSTINEDLFGASVSMSDDGNRVVIGATHLEGRVEVFEWSGSKWTRMGEPFFGESSGRRFSSGLTVLGGNDGNRVAKTDEWFNQATSDSGRVRVYDWKQDSSSWQQVGNDIVGYLPDMVEAFLGQGVAMSRNGQRVAVGLALSRVRNIDRMGTVRVYELRGGSSWVQMGNDLVINYDAIAWPIARSLSLSDDGQRLVIGDKNLGFGGSGQAHIFEWNGTQWELMIELRGKLAQDAFGGDGWGVSMSGAGDRVLVGADFGKTDETCIRTGSDLDCRNGYVQAFQFHPTTGPFPNYFSDITCIYSSCLAELLELFNRRLLHTTLDTPDQKRYASKVQSKLNKAIWFIGNDGLILRSLDKLQNAMKFVENLKDKTPLFNVGYAGSTCAAQFVRDTVRAFNDEDTLSTDFLDRLRKNQLATARRLRTENQWKASVSKSRGAMWIVTNELGEKKVPVCLD